MPPLPSRAVALALVHEAQLVNHLTAAGIDVGLLLNVGAASLQFRRKMRDHGPGRSGRASEAQLGHD